MLLPTGLFYSRDKPFPGQFPKTDAAKLESPKVTAGPAADGAAVIFTGGKLGFLLPSVYLRFLSHL